MSEKSPFFTPFSSTSWILNPLLTPPAPIAVAAVVVSTAFDFFWF